MDNSQTSMLSGETVPAGVLPNWTTGDLPDPPTLTWRNLSSLIGPGILLAGASIASGEWLAGPGLTAQFGGTLLWIATLSIVAQVFANIEFMRYTIYCGEPVLVGAFRTWPGPVLWVFVYACLEVAQIWPYNVANAAVPLAAATIGHLPGPEDAKYVKVLGVALFLLAFLPLIFGGTVYKSLERIMSAKMVFVLLFLGFVACFLISANTAYEVFRGFVSFGKIPVRADTIVDGRHFLVTQYDGAARLTVRGTLESSGTVVTEWKLDDKVFSPDDPKLRPRHASLERILAWTEEMVKKDRYFVADVQESASVSAAGNINTDGSWAPPDVIIKTAGGTRTYQQLSDIPDAEIRERIDALVSGRGLQRVSMLRYLRKHGRLPELDWALIAAFASIAGGQVV